MQDATNPNPWNIPDPFRRRKVRRHLLPIDPARSKSTGVLMWAPVYDALPEKPEPLVKISSSNNSRTKNLPLSALSRMVKEWPDWTIKQWLKAVNTTPYLYRRPQFQKRIADVKSRPKRLILANASSVGGLKLACLVAGHVRFNYALLKLDLSSNSLTHHAIAIVCCSLEQHQCCKEVNLSDNFICSEGAQAVARLLQRSNTIVNFKLRNANLTESGTKFEGVHSMAVGLRLNTSVEELDLAGNALGLAGSAALVSKLTHNWRLECLNLENNHLADADAIQLIKLIETASAAMPTYRNRIKVSSDVLSRPFSLGERIHVQPTVLTSNTRWSHVDTIKHETVEQLIDAGIRLTQARVDRMRVQKELESQRFRLPKKEKPIYVPPPVSSAWDVLGRVRPELSSRIAEKMRDKGIRMPERYAADDWYEQKLEDQKKAALAKEGIVHLK